MIIGAAGEGKRFGAQLPKQFLKINNKTILQMSIGPFNENELVDQIIVVCHRDFIAQTQNICNEFEKVSKVICGGKERQDSISRGLEELDHCNGESLVLIHDGARPFVSREIIERVIDKASSNGAAVPCVPVKDTIRIIDRENKDISRTLDRNSLVAVQTPQGFNLSLIRKAYENAFENDFLGTDDASLVELLGERVYMVMGDYKNLKITTKEDLPKGVTHNDSMPGLRIGTGYDVHRLVEGRKLVLCGVEVPYQLGLLGHSDADVATHALMDAVLGAASLGDIGKLFPDSDQSFKGISSMILLRKVMDEIKSKGFRIGNADITIVAQKPKLAPYIEEMRDTLAKEMEIPKDLVSVKATTTEKLGFAGRGEGIEAQAVCSIYRIGD